MTNFRVPNRIITILVFLNFIMLFACIVNLDYVGMLLSIICIGCFIFTYKLNQWERNEKEKKKQSD